ncbi:MAG: ubiquinone biosynthesis protein [Betaproteobacteria bacterium]|nr:ubiquinone biosynthesis protein [Betaproteobacteria bacterium]
MIASASASLAAGAINRLTAATPLARERLMRFAGKTAVFRVGPLPVALTVQTTGEVLPAAEGAAGDLEVRLSPFLLPRLAAHDEAAYRDVETTGDVEFAGEVAFLAKHLKWDVEEDLSKVVGDAAANRMVTAARGAAAWGKDASERMAAGAAEYFTEEDPLIASRVKVEDFVAGVSELRDAVERLEKRIEIIEKRGG